MLVYGCQAGNKLRFELCKSAWRIPLNSRNDEFSLENVTWRYKEILLSLFEFSLRYFEFWWNAVSTYLTQNSRSSQNIPTSINIVSSHYLNKKIGQSFDNFFIIKWKQIKASSTNEYQREIFSFNGEQNKQNLMNSFDAMRDFWLL